MFFQSAGAAVKRSAILPDVVHVEAAVGNISIERSCGHSRPPHAVGDIANCEDGDDRTDNPPLRLQKP